MVFYRYLKKFFAQIKKTFFFIQHKKNSAHNFLLDKTNNFFSFLDKIKCFFPKIKNFFTSIFSFIFFIIKMLYFSNKQNKEKNLFLLKNKFLNFLFSSQSKSYQDRHSARDREKSRPFCYWRSFIFIFLLMILLCIIIWFVFLVDKNFSSETKNKILHFISVTVICIRDIYHFEFGQGQDLDFLSEKNNLLLEDKKEEIILFPEDEKKK